LKVVVRLGGGAIVEKREILPPAKIDQISATLSRRDRGRHTAVTRKLLAAWTSSLSQEEQQVLEYCEMWRSLARLLPLPSDERIP
jgi:hypothetical protein